MRILLNAALLGATLLSTSFHFEVAFARFNHQDASQVDQEERLDAASYHDANTYRWYPHFNALWETKDVGYRISDGSFDADRSRIHEQIKLSTSTAEAIWFSYKRDYFHDLVDEIRDEELRLAWQPAWGVYVAALADGNSSYKQWGDLGAAAGWRHDRDSWVEAYAWSVDHFYDSKQEVNLGEYVKKPKTTGLRMNWAIPQTYALFMRYEKDDPMEWDRDDCECVYRHRASTFEYNVKIFLKSPWSVELFGGGGFKAESNSYFADAGRTASSGLPIMPFYAKSLGKRTSRHDATVTYATEDGGYYYGGFTRIERKADYEQESHGSVSVSDFREPVSPDAAHRQVIASVFRSVAIGGSRRYFWQGGLTQAWIRIDQGFDDSDLAGMSGDEQTELRELNSGAGAIEQKFQNAFEIQFREQAFLFLNATFDVDGIRSDWPYRKAPKAGNIWDGGGIQIMVVF